MSRLTDRCWRNLDPWECCGQNFHCSRKLNDDGGCINGCIVPKLYKHLAEYEDLEEQGLLLKLPCKIGDIIYEVDEAILLDDVIEPIKCKVTYILLKTEIHIDVEVIEGHGIGSTYTFKVEDFGKTVFLTKEEAEKALERLECAE